MLQAGCVALGSATVAWWVGPLGRERTDSTGAIQRHWQLVCCGFSFCWYHQAHLPATEPVKPAQPPSTTQQERQEVPGAHKAREKRKAKGWNGHRCPGPKPYERFADGSNPGSCSSGFGTCGRHSPHPSRSSNSLSISGAAPLCTCMPPIDLSQQSCGSGPLSNELDLILL